MKYTIHDIVGIELDESYPWPDSLLDDRLTRVENDHEYRQCKQFLSIQYIKKSDLSTANYREVAPGVWINETRMIHFRYGVRISVSGPNRIVLETIQECIEWFEICLQMLFLREDCTLVHAAAVSKDGIALVMPSWGGVGKTACVAELVRNQGWKLLGDDLVIVQSDGNILAYPKKFVIYPYHKTLFPSFFKKKSGPKLPLWLNSYADWLLPMVREGLRRFPKLLAYARRSNPQSKRVSPTQLFDNRKTIIANKGIAGTFAWIERVDDEISIDEALSTVSCKQLSSQAAGVTMLDVTKASFPAVSALVAAGIIGYDTYFGAIQRTIASACKESETLCVRIPKSVSVEEVPSWIIHNLQLERWKSTV